ncbi:MAG: hypothetical protein JWN32_4447, partial [Solirubrobacterales bacterium]|nr:hypothetical protein [Solirubrobacterales bacterium]
VLYKALGCAASSAARGALADGACAGWSADHHEPLPHAHLHPIDVVLRQRASVGQRSSGAVHLLEVVLDPCLVAKEVLEVGPPVADDLAQL